MLDTLLMDPNGNGKRDSPHSIGSTHSHRRAPSNDVSFIERSRLEKYQRISVERIE